VGFSISAVVYGRMDLPAEKKKGTGPKEEKYEDHQSEKSPAKSPEKKHVKLCARTATILATPPPPPQKTPPREEKCSRLRGTRNYRTLEEKKNLETNTRTCSIISFSTSAKIHERGGKGNVESKEYTVSSGKSKSSWSSKKKNVTKRTISLTKKRI